MKSKLLKKMFDRPIAYHRALVPFAGVTGAVLLSQAIYWSKRLEEDRDGWFYKTRDEWNEETGLTRKEQETARKKLTSLGILEEKLQGIPAQLWFRVNFDVLQTCLLESDQQVGTKVTNKEVRKVPTYYTETTPEITQKDFSEKLSVNHTDGKTPSSSEQSTSFQGNDLQSDGSELQELLEQRATRKVKRELKRKYNGSVPPWVDVDKIVEKEVKVNTPPSSVTITQEYRDFCEFISKDRKAIHIATIEGQRAFNVLKAEGYLVPHIKCACRIAYRVDDFWKNNFTPELFFRKKAYGTGEALDHVGKFLNARANDNPEITKIKQEMKNELGE